MPRLRPRPQPRLINELFQRGAGVDRPAGSIARGSAPNPRNGLRSTFSKCRAKMRCRCHRRSSRQKNGVSYCGRCFNLSESGNECSICVNPRREDGLVCVVEDSQDIVAIERTQEFRGRYHVLGGAFSPIDGVGAEQLRIKELMGRLADEDISEVIVATNPNLEGEATAALLVKYLKPMGVRVTRLAMGLPVGGDLEYADELTLGRALEGRKVIDDSETAPAVGAV